MATESEAAPATDDEDDDEMSAERERGSALPGRPEARYSGQRPAERTAAPATDDEDENRMGAAPATDDDSELEDLTAGRTAASARKRAQPSEPWQRNERARRTPRQSPPQPSLARARSQECGASGSSPQAMTTSARQPGNAHEHSSSSDEELLMVGPKGANRALQKTEQGLLRAADKEAAKERKAEERAAAKARKAQEAEAAKLLKAQQREQARMQKQAAQAALKLQKEQDKAVKRKTSGKSAHDNVFISVDDRAGMHVALACTRSRPARVRTRGGTHAHARTHARTHARARAHTHTHTHDTRIRTLTQLSVHVV